MSGIERSVDKLGRIVLPIKYRKKLGIEADDTVIVSLDEGVITVAPTKKICALCGKHTLNSLETRICDLCIQKINESQKQIKNES